MENKKLTANWEVLWGLICKLIILWVKIWWKFSKCINWSNSNSVKIFLSTKLAPLNKVKNKQIKSSTYQMKFPPSISQAHMQENSRVRTRIKICLKLEAEYAGNTFQNLREEKNQRKACPKLSLSFQLSTFPKQML